MVSAYGLTACAVMVPGILWASWIDYRERRVPNWLNAAIAVAGLAAQAWFHGFSGLGSGLLGMAVGAWLGPWATFLSFCAGALAGGLIAALMIFSTGRQWQAYANCATILAKVSNRSTIFTEFGSAKSFGSSSQLLPYGVPLTIGTLIVFFSNAAGVLY